MNLRILKKLSKRAAPLLPILGDCRDQFPAEKHENYTSVGGHDWKHWERTRSVHDKPFPGTIKYRPKHGKAWVAMREPVHPLKGTPMVGEMSGYYEPEWDEQTAWEALERIVLEHFTDWDENGPTLLRDLSTTRLVLAAARELVASQQKEAA
ncbi:hypothetical protein [Caballeronia sp. AZ7_KS35]|uniref:hypothetical protein n=1 Tax=Caballeronia sp. AZ7_KS35 TaxID=2921762 RepID=UPI00202777CC|nr:hypothetical protein [Caballeronia sp. AZ7_KS35]